MNEIEFAISSINTIIISIMTITNIIINNIIIIIIITIINIESEKGAWWTVDMAGKKGGKKCVGRVVIFNRKDCCSK